MKCIIKQIKNLLVNESLLCVMCAPYVCRPANKYLTSSLNYTMLNGPIWNYDTFN